jgi:hypothetical protein
MGCQLGPKSGEIGMSLGVEMEKKLRSKAKALSDDTKKAILVGGSSHANLISPI